MCQPPSAEAVRAMLGQAVPADATIEQVQPVPSVLPQRIYEVRLSNSDTLHLVLPPLSMWRPLRSEQGVLQSEATAVRWISEAVTRRQQELKLQRRQQPPSSSPPQPDDHLPPPLLPFLPTLLHHSPESHLPNSSFSVYRPVRGTPLTLLSPTTPPPPTTTALQTIDRQLGTLFRTLAALTSPTGRFGPLAAVIGNSSTTTTTTTAQPTPDDTLERTAVGAAAAAARPPPPQRVRMEGGLAATGGAGSWSVAFHSMLEGVLRDGEDMAVVMAYPTIRRHFRRLGYLLDEVTVGRLVVVRAGGRGNVLVDGGGGGEGGGRGEGKGKGLEAGEETEFEGNAETNDEPPLQSDTQILTLTGLRDWSSAIFGDPLLATVFSDPHQLPPSPSFLDGFNNSFSPDSNPPNNTTNLPYPLNPTIIQSPATAHIRLLLYQVYHAVARIVSEFYRPRQQSSTRELEARRKLNEVLARLAEVGDDGGGGVASGVATGGVTAAAAAAGDAVDIAKRRLRRGSGEMSPAKRVRGGEDD